MNTSWVKVAVSAMLAVEVLLASSARIFTRLIDDTQLFRRVGMALAFYITYSSIEFCYRYAHTAQTQEQMVGAAAVIAAIMAPVGTMQAALFKFYVDSSLYRYKKTHSPSPSSSSQPE